MELTELQAIWQQYDRNLKENTQINKEILKQFLILKPRKRLRWEKMKAGFNLILPVVLILLVLVPNTLYRASIDFYAGVLMFGIVSSILYYWAIKYYFLIGKIEFSNPITSIKKNIKQLETYKFKLKKIGFILMPFGITGIFLMAGIPFFTKEFILPLSLIILVIAISVYYTFKYSVFEQFRMLNKELEEVEKLEKE
jgi:hypothetical protein